MLEQYFQYFIFILFCAPFFSFYVPHVPSFIQKKRLHNTVLNYKYEKEYFDFYQKFHSPVLSSTGKTMNLTNFIESNLEKYTTFAKNYDYIQETNKLLKEDNSTLVLGLNQFADAVNFESDLNNDLMYYTKSHIQATKETYFKPFKNPLGYINNVIQKRVRFNWNDTNCLSPVKNQLSCGSCWAFSTTSALETFMRHRHYNITRLSEQELVDCSSENNGCNGGIMHKAMDFIIKNGGLHTHDDYPYNANDNHCNKLMLNTAEGSNITKYDFIIPHSVIDMMVSVKKNPVAIGVDADNFYFRFYREGVIDIPANYSQQLNHAVLLVGYDFDDIGPYWIIQNSWGESWGEKGFCKLRVKDNQEGTLMCQVYGVYPTQ